METALEQVLTTFYKTGMISYLAEHPEDFEEAIQLAISNKQPYSWRAAWLLWSYMEKNDPRIKKHINSIINSIPSKKDGHQRELIKILQQMELDDEQEGFLFDACITLWEKISKKPSVRYVAFNTIVSLAKKYPDLSHELVFLTQDHYLDALSPGVKNAVQRMIREFVR